MASSIKVGDTVRINEKYNRILGGVLENTVGTEFIVTDTRMGSKPLGHESDQIISGDPNGWGVWGDFLDVVKAKEPKSHTTTLIPTRLNWENVEKIVRVTNGTGAVSLTVAPNPSEYGDTTGTTTLTADQAEQLANDLLERVAEIRAGLKVEAGE